MYSAIRNAARAIRLGAGSARDITTFNDDTFIVSYPKSGNTWARFLIANLLCANEDISFANIEQKIPDIYQHTNRTLMNLSRPRILKSHEYFNPLYNNVIYMIRDPRSIIISYYNYLKNDRNMDSVSSLSSFVDVFICGSFDGYGSWGQHVGSWLWEVRNNKNMLLLKYESLLENAEKELEKIFCFFNIDVTREDILRAIELSSFDRMRELEVQQPEYMGKSRHNLRRSDIPFVREGKAKGWETILSPLDRQKIEETWSGLMKEFDYLD